MIAIDEPLVGAPTHRAEGHREVSLTWATSSQAPELQRLIGPEVAQGHLLPRAADDLIRHAPRFVVALDTDRVVACGELAPLGQTIAEIRSLVVDGSLRHTGLAAQVVQRLVARARRDGFRRVCAFTGAPRAFVGLGFSLVPHVWMTEKIARDCHQCSWLRRCPRVAVSLDLCPAARHLDPQARESDQRPSA